MVAFYHKSLVAAFALSVASTSAIAGNVEFSFKTHELQTSSGVDALYSRLEFKAKKACKQSKAKALYAKQVARECRANFVSEVVNSIDDRRLDNAHAAATQDSKDYASN